MSSMLNKAGSIRIGRCCKFKMQEILKNMINKKSEFDSDYKFANEDNLENSEFREHFERIEKADLEKQTSERLDEVIASVEKIIDLQVKLEKTYQDFLLNPMKDIFEYFKIQKNKDLDLIAMKLLRNLDIQYADLMSLDKKTKKNIINSFSDFKEQLFTSSMAIEEISELSIQLEQICNRSYEKEHGQLNIILQGKQRLERVKSDNNLLTRIRKYLRGPK